MPLDATLNNSTNDANHLLERLSAQSQATPREELETIFLEGEREFDGADCDQSLMIGEDRYLWMFADTLIGRRSEGKTPHMPRNTVGILRLNQGKPRFSF